MLRRFVVQSVTPVIAMLYAMASSVAAYADGNTIHVPADHRTIQAAIDAATEGDTIIVAPGTYSENVIVNKMINLIASDGPEVTTLDAQDSGTVIGVETDGAGSTFEGLTITGGNSTAGGGMHIIGDHVTVTDCIFQDNRTPTLNVGGGAGMYIKGDNVIVKNSAFKNNFTKAHGGGIRVLGNSVLFTDCNFQNNASGLSGGAIHIEGDDHTITNCVFDTNDAFEGGGIYGFASSALLVNNCVFVNNSSEWFGAGMYVQNVYVTVANCHFQNHSTWAGGAAITNLYSVIGIGDSRFCENTPDDIKGKWNDLGGNEFLDECPPDCTPEDLNCDGVVDGADLGILLANWGPCEDCDDCPADLNGDCKVDGADLGILLANWG